MSKGWKIDKIDIDVPESFMVIQLCQPVTFTV